MSIKERYYQVSGVVGSYTNSSSFSRWEVITKGNGISPELLSRVKSDISNKYSSIKDIYIRVDSIVDKMDDYDGIDYYLKHLSV